MNRTPMRLCGKPYDSVEAAENSEAFKGGGEVDTRCPCGNLHVRARRQPQSLQRSPLRRISAKRAAANRERRKVIADLFPERPRCAVPGCPRLADDVHEPLTRARGGSITDPDNMVPLCRIHHDEITFSPESELEWAYDLGLLIHSWDAPGGTSCRA